MRLWGIDCLYPDCKHDSARGYRLSIKLLRSAVCVKCGQEGTACEPQFNPGKAASSAHASDPYDHDWLTCLRCATKWQAGKWMVEQPDMVLQAYHLQSALSQLVSCGLPNSRAEDLHRQIEHGKFSGAAIYELEKPKLASGEVTPAFPLRRLTFSAEALPRVAIYFRWDMLANEALTNEKVFQCYFPPGASAADRRIAPEIPVQNHCFSEITKMLGSDGSGYVDTWINIRCQHCQRKIPLKAFNRSSLREVEKGD